MQALCALYALVISLLLVVFSPTDATPLPLYPFAAWAHPLEPTFIGGRYNASASAVGSVVVIAGGTMLTRGIGGAVDFVEIVDMGDAGLFTYEGPPLAGGARSWMGVANAGPKALFVGGVLANGSVSAAVDIYDSETNTWSLSALPSGPRKGVAGAMLTARAFFFGGYTAADEFIPVIDWFSAPSASWHTSTAVVSIPEPFIGPALGHGDTVLLIPASGAAPMLFDAVKISFSRTPPMPGPPRTHFAAVVVGSLALVAGGQYANGTLSSELAVYDFTTGAWSAGPPMPAPRRDLSPAAVGPYGVFLVNYLADPADLIGTATWLYDTVGRTWALAANSFSTSRVGAAFVGLGYRALVAGGLETPGMLIGFKQALNVDPPLTCTAVDDAAIGNGTDLFAYHGSGWHHCSSGHNCAPGAFLGTDSWTDLPGDDVILPFIGSQVFVYATVGNTRGSLWAIVRSASEETQVPLTATQAAGDVFVYQSALLPHGSYSLQLVNRNPAGLKMTVDRVNVCAGRCNATALTPRARVATPGPLCGRPEVTIVVDNCADLVAQGAIVSWTSNFSIGPARGCNFTQVFGAGSNSVTAVAHNGLPCQALSAPVPFFVHISSDALRILLLSCDSPYVFAAAGCSPPHECFPDPAAVVWEVDGAVVGTGSRLTYALLPQQVLTLSVVSDGCSTARATFALSRFAEFCTCSFLIQ